MQRQYFLMAYPRPQSLVLDVESVMRELLERDSSINRDNVKDCPPKYEDIAEEESPPQYDEETMKTEIEDKESSTKK